jgi:hypothetical protein
MSNGLHIFLADDDDVVRLSDGPLFTLSDGSTEVLSEKTGMAFTWPVGSPANLTATISQDRARWQAIYLPDRILIRMDPGWTQFEKSFFAVPARGHGNERRRAGSVSSRYLALVRKWTHSPEPK